MSKCMQGSCALVSVCSGGTDADFGTIKSCCAAPALPTATCKHRDDNECTSFRQQLSWYAGMHTVQQLVAHADALLLCSHTYAVYVLWSSTSGQLLQQRCGSGVCSHPFLHWHTHRKGHVYSITKNLLEPCTPKSCTDHWHEHEPACPPLAQGLLHRKGRLASQCRL